MEWSALDYRSFQWQLIATLVGTIMFFMIAVLASGAKNKKCFGIASAIAIGFFIAFVVFVFIGAFREASGECRQGLREGTYKYDVVFVNEARDNSYYLVVRGSHYSSSGNRSEEPRVQRCLELAPSTMVTVNGSPANNVLPESVLYNGVLEVVKEKGHQYEQVIYRISYGEKGQ